MKRQKPNFIRDWADEFTRWDKWFARKMERLLWKRSLSKIEEFNYESEVENE